MRLDLSGLCPLEVGSRITGPAAMWRSETNKSHALGGREHIQ